MKKEANSIGNILCRNCLLRQERQKVREDDEDEYWNLKEGAPHPTI